jgi:hypothetical protein
MERNAIMEMGDILERMTSRGGMAIVKRGNILERGDIISWKGVTIRTPTMYVLVLEYTCIIFLCTGVWFISNLEK